MSEIDFWLSVDALAAITAESDAKYPLETGGVLAGYPPCTVVAQYRLAPAVSH